MPQESLRFAQDDNQHVILSNAKDLPTLGSGLPQEILRFAQDDNQHVILSNAKDLPTPGSGLPQEILRFAHDDNQHVILSNAKDLPTPGSSLPQESLRFAQDSRFHSEIYGLNASDHSPPEKPNCNGWEEGLAIICKLQLEWPLGNPALKNT